MVGCNSSNKSKTSTIAVASMSSIVDDFSSKDPAWSIKKGDWSFSNDILKQSATDESFPVILLEKSKIANFDLSVDFRPISGSADASGGVIFRAIDKDNYYIVRANALEGNFRLYTFKNGNRTEIATADVVAPKMGEFHTIRVVAKANHIQAYLDKKLYIDHKDDSFSNGYVGLWTKADSVTEFDNLTIKIEK
jgi:hypothetical protein